ncbi:MAG: glycoside hydrolase family 2 TIM barrel-domain containing protein [Bacteroidota bacterium]
MTLSRLALPALALLLALPASAQAGRQVIPINAGWDYLEQAAPTPEAANAARGWTTVSLPHSWNVWDTADLEPGYRRDASWYRKTMDLAPQSGRRMLLYFEGAAMTADVYVNGERAGGHVGGYVGFDVDITDQVQAGPNEILVRVSNAYDPDLIPSQKADYFLYGGLTRDVFLKEVPATYIERAHVLTPSVSAASGEVALRLALGGDGPGAGHTVRARLIDPSGATVQTVTEAVPAGTRDSVAVAFAPVATPALWSTRDPNLYRVEVELLADGAVADRVTEPLGFRWFEFREHGAFYLNGERLLLRGTHRHEDHAGYASAIPNEIHRRDMAMMKEIGANFVRLGHYPQDPVIYQAADSLGILLWDELPWNRGGMGGPAWMANTERLLREMIAQNLNHPSIITWSLGNEIYWLPDFPGGDDTDRLNEMLAHLHEVARELDPSRPTSIRKYYEGSDIVDVFSPSIWAGWYSGVYTAYETALLDAQETYPRLLHMEFGGSSHVGRHTERPIDGEGFVDPDQWSESISQVEVRSIANNGDWSESYIVDLFDWSLRVSETLPEFTGNAQWAFKDFGTPLRPENDLPYVNQKGLVTRDGTPKDAYYVFRSVWTDPDEGDAPMCWIESHTWTERAGPAGETLPVTVYCNTDAARLAVNGADQGTRQRDPSVFPAAGLVWDVTFALGENTIIATGIEEGADVVSDTLVVTYHDTPAGRPDEIVLTAEPMANGHLLIVATMRDADGRRVLDYEDDVYFSLDGAGELLVGWGTPTRSQRVGFANGRAAIEMIPGDGPATVSALNQDFKGSYLPLPDAESLTERR